MSGPFYPRTKRYTLSPVLFSSASQKGFSALSLFFMGLILLILMNFTGFFTHPKSPITDKNVYTATDAKKLDVKEGLHMVDLDFKPPAAPTISGTPTPTSAVCISDSGKKTDPSVCKCPYFTFLCVNGKAVEMNGHPNEFPYNDSLCKTYAKEGDGYYCIGKPVIYLYPEKPTYVDVTVSGNIVESIPLVEKGRLRTATSSQGWFGVLAMPGGVLKYKNQYFRELYYESETVVLGKTFITPYYQISYPEIYAPTLYAEQEGVLNGLLLSDALGDSRVEISVFDNKATTIARLSEIPISLGLTKGQTNVGQYLGESYSGVSPGMKVYEKIVLIRKENVIIKFQLMQLTGPTKEGQTEFESILQSFQ